MSSRGNWQYPVLLLWLVMDHLTRGYGQPYRVGPLHGTSRGNPGPPSSAYVAGVTRGHPPREVTRGPGITP